jgi:propanol-preferring alcohol dehydrogenase
MKACLLNSPARIETNPLHFTDVPMPNPGKGEVLVRVHACGVCRTDLHVIEGELPPRKSPVIPGHQVVGVVEKLGEGSRRFAIGARVGVAWLHHTDGVCEYCRMGEENLCGSPTFTGYSVDGGYAEYIVAPEDFVYALPQGFPDEQAAPLLCAGIIGFRSLRLSGIKPGGRLGFYGFGAAAHVAIQVGAILERHRLCVHARRASPEAGAAAGRGVGRRYAGCAAGKTRCRNCFCASGRDCSRGACRFAQRRRACAWRNSHEPDSVVQLRLAVSRANDSQRGE